MSNTSLREPSQDAHSTFARSLHLQPRLPSFEKVLECTGMGGSFTLTGARVSYFDIHRQTGQIIDAGLAYDVIYDHTGEIASDASFLSNDFAGLSRLCSSALIEPAQFRGAYSDGVPEGDDDDLAAMVDGMLAAMDKGRRGLEDRIYFTGEEDGGGFNAVGGNEWALDPDTRSLWALPDLGRGAWENVTEVDTGRTDMVAILLADDTSPFDADPEAENGDEAAPLFLYVGQKDTGGDFVARNGLRGGTLHVWVSDTGETSPLEFNGSGTLSGSWVPVDNSPTGTPSEDGSTGFDEYGYPTQRNLWVQARALGAFGFSHPEGIEA